MLVKILGPLFILLFIVGCESTPEAVSSAQSTDTPDFDNAPVTYDIFPANIAEDAQSGWIFLSYTDADNDEATSCQIAERQYVNVTSPCVCLYGLCRLRVTGFSNYTGPASFRYSITANNVTSQMSLATFNITSVVEAPVANDVAFLLYENTTYTSDGTISKPHLKGTDPDGDPLTCIKVSDPLYGVVTVNANCSFSYTPNANYVGPDSFTYKVNDGTYDSSVALVNITSLRVNTAPVANATVASVYQGATVSFSLSASDADGDALTYSLLSTPSGLSIVGSTVTYVSNPSFNGTISFDFRVNDGELNSNTATATITVLPPAIFLSATGNDATAVINDPTKPFLTAQAAVDAAIAFAPSAIKPLTIDVGAGNFGNIVLPPGFLFGRYITWRGVSAATSIIGDITANGISGAAGAAVGVPANGDWDGDPGSNGRPLEIISDLNVTFGNISANGGDGGLHAPDTVTFAAKPGVAGAGAAILNLKGHFGTISAVGGSGHGGAPGGTVVLRAGSTSGSIDTSGGLDLCTVALSCATSLASGHGGNITVEVGAVVNGNIVSNGGSNNGLDGVSIRIAGNGGTLTINGNVNGNISSHGGNSYDSTVGEGGTVTVGNLSNVSGSISVLSGNSTNIGDSNRAGIVSAFGNVQDVYANSHPLIGGNAGEVHVYSTARDIYVHTSFVNCGASAGDAYIYLSGVARNVYAQGGNDACTTPSAGFVNVFGRVTDLINVDGGVNTNSSENAGKAGRVRVNQLATVNLISADGGDALATTCKPGGAGGTIEITTGATYNIGDISVAGGTGDTGCSMVNGTIGTITIN